MPTAQTKLVWTTEPVSNEFGTPPYTSQRFTNVRVAVRNGHKRKPVIIIATVLDENNNVVEKVRFRVDPRTIETRLFDVSTEDAFIVKIRSTMEVPPLRSKWASIIQPSVTAENSSTGESEVLPLTIVRPRGFTV
ncbi:hypothetical protein [Halalkalibacter hemicellulosilyticus]|uniref:hypothetical protein n=1 Tax=Halalkalibacter hemicellulosilyticus TaxID=127886 RepID=UPI0005538203|nr:hypothetical protein [Halalkalibacter hemicellulosilyticus]